MPDGWSDEPAGAVPTIKLTGIAGATVLVRAGVTGEGASLRVICASAPSSRWAPGVESLVLDRASQIARDASGDLTRFEPGPIEVRGDRFEQSFRGEGASRVVWGKHLLGFAGRDREAVLCTAICTTNAGDSARCASLVALVTPSGAWSQAPPASVSVRAILFAAERPVVALAIACALLVVGIGLVLLRRPRPRRF